MTDLGRYFIRVIDQQRVYIKSNTTGRSASLMSITEIPEFIKADVLNEVFVPKIRTNTEFEIQFGQSLQDFQKDK